MRYKNPKFGGIAHSVVALDQPVINISATEDDRQASMIIFNAALAAVAPYQAVLNAVSIQNNRLQFASMMYELDSFTSIIVVGAGKAAARMALAIESLLGDKITAGLIVVKYGHTTPLSLIEQVEAAHPVPNEAGITGTQGILQMVQAADDKTLVICLLSGGASALLVCPVQGITLQDEQETTRLLLNSGASINELNAVRKHISMVKGGRFAQAAYPAQLLALIISDVIDDTIDVIASGPTAADSSTFTDALAVIAKYSLQEKIPLNVIDYLQNGSANKFPETVKAGDPGLSKTHNVIVASIHQALTAASEKAVRLGYGVRIISESLQGEARNAAHLLAQAAREELVVMKDGELCCLLCGGETTVIVRGNGRGGRNQELALAFALEVEGWSDVTLLSAGTDGGDGPTDAAGAIVDGKTASRARSLGLDPLMYLNRNDSYTFFQKLGAASDAQSHLKTGPTGTNVMDMQIIVLRKGECAS